VPSLVVSHERLDRWLALEYAETRSGRFNLGSGAGHSNREVIAAVQRVTGREIAIDQQPRRPGDPPALVAASDLARRELGWRPRYTDLEAIVTSAWRWRQAHPHGYAGRDEREHA